MNDYYVTIDMGCPFCGRRHSVTVWVSEWNAFENGDYAQVAFPSLSESEREQIISNLCPDCIAEVYGIK